MKKLILFFIIAVLSITTIGCSNNKDTKESTYKDKLVFIGTFSK